MRRMIGLLIVSVTLLTATPAGANPPSGTPGPPIGGCPPAGGWTLRPVTEFGAPDEADVNGDGWLCGKDVTIPAFPGFDNYVDNVIK
jgi:hypothetical protein